MAIDFGSVQQLGAAVDVSALNSGLAAARRVALSADGILSGRIIVENGSDSIRAYYLSGDSSVDCTSVATAEGFIHTGGTMIIELASGSTHVSFWAASDITIGFNEVR